MNNLKYTFEQKCLVQYEGIYWQLFPELYTYNDVNHVVVIINDIILRILRTCFSLTGVSWLLIALLMATVCRKKRSQSC